MTSRKIAYAVHRRQHDRKERRQEDQKNRREVADAEPDHGQRHPRQRRDRAQHLDQRIERLRQRRPPSEGEAHGDPEHDRGDVATEDAEERVARVGAEMRQVVQAAQDVERRREDLRAGGDDRDVPEGEEQKDEG